MAEADLRPLAGPQVGEGGQAEINWVASPSGEVMLFKKYRPTVLRGDSRQRLGEMVSFRHKMNPAMRACLDERTAWLRHVVISHRGGVSGVLIPPAPPQFWWRDKHGIVKPREISELAPDQDRARRLSKDFFAVPQVVARLGHLIETMRFLHRNGVVLGDVHSGNVLVSGLGTRPRTLLLDCDAMILNGREALVRAALPKVWSEEMGDWPDPFNSESDLAFFAYTAVGLIGKDLSLIEVTQEVRKNLLHVHADLLDTYLHRRDPDASATQLGAVAALWQSCASEGSEEYIRHGASRERQPWTGPASFLASPYPQQITLPAALDPLPRTTLVPPVHTSNGRISSPVLARPARRKWRWRLVFAAAASLAALGATSALGVFDHHSTPPAPAAGGLAPQNVPVAQENLAKAMSNFPNVKDVVGTLTVRGPTLLHQHGVVTATLALTGVTSEASSPLQLSYDCTHRITKTTGANLAPGPYLLVAGTGSVSSAGSFAMPWWTLHDHSAAAQRYSLYAPICAFHDGAKVSVPAAIRVPMHGTWQAVPAKTPKIVFAVPSDGKATGPVLWYPRRTYAFVWVTAGGWYLYSRIGA